MTIADCFTFSNAFETPIDSITSVVSRNPAVSMNRNRIPSIVISSSMVSRVVPGISETMARSSSTNAFKRVLFPGSLHRGTKNRYWYVECTPTSSDKWAINRAAAAQLRRDGIPQSKIREHLFKFQNENPPTVKTVKSDFIPDNEKNVIVLKGN